MAEYVQKPELSKLGQAIANFKARYEKLASPSYGAAIARTGDNELMQEYGNTLARAKQIKSAIESIEGAWTRAKEWAGLSALPLIPIAIATSITATVLAGISLIDDFMVRADAKLMMQTNPALTYDKALELATEQNKSTFERALDVTQLALVIGGGILLYLFMRR